MFSNVSFLLSYSFHSVVTNLIESLSTSCCLSPGNLGYPFLSRLFTSNNLWTSPHDQRYHKASLEKSALYYISIFYLPCTTDVTFLLINHFLWSYLTFQICSKFLAHKELQNLSYTSIFIFHNKVGVQWIFVTNIWRGKNTTVSSLWLLRQAVY